MIYSDSNNYFKYIMIGEFQTDKKWIHPEVIVDNYELIFVTDGVVSIEEDREKYTLEKNQMLILDPGKLHGGFAESAPPTGFYWFHFETDMEMPFKLSMTENYYEIKMLLKKLLHITNSPNYPKSAADAAGLMLFYEMCQNGSTASPHGSVPVNRMCEYIRINIGNGITAAKTAEHFGYNHDYAGKLFKSVTGVGLKEYICSQKIKKAENLLLSTALTVKQIAASLGYPDENLFIKFFKYHEEITPTEYRSRYNRVHINNA